MTDSPPVTDTPVALPTTKLDASKAFLGDLARPYVLLIISSAAAASTVMVASKVDGPEAALFITAVLGGVAALYGAKAMENAATAKQTATVAVAQAKAPPPIIVTPAEATGELPAGERIR